MLWSRPIIIIMLGSLNKANSFHKFVAVYLKNGTMNVGTSSRVIFAHNSASNGGAVFLNKSVMNVKPNASMSFCYNTMEEQLHCQ